MALPKMVEVGAGIATGVGEGTDYSLPYNGTLFFQLD